MKWPGIRERIRGNLCPGLRRRVDFHIAAFKETDEGAYDRAWITVDGERTAELFSASEFIPLLFDYLDIPPAEALRSETPLWRALAAADRRLRPATLKSLAMDRESDALVRRFIALRLGEPGAYLPETPR